MNGAQLRKLVFKADHVVRSPLPRDGFVFYFTALAKSYGKGDGSSGAGERVRTNKHYRIY